VLRPEAPLGLSSFWRWSRHMETSAKMKICSTPVELWLACGLRTRRGVVLGAILGSHVYEDHLRTADLRFSNDTRYTLQNGPEKYWS
jgi:hypothetical protein